jgi:hypothetical protein
MVGTIYTDHATDTDTSMVVMPHPLAYAYRVSREMTVLKANMKGYCSNIQQVKEESDEISQRLFSEKQPSKTQLRVVSSKICRRLKWLEEEEQIYRSGFQLARCLWQLERTMVETYVAWQQWERSKICVALIKRQTHNRSNKTKKMEQRFLERDQGGGDYCCNDNDSDNDNDTEKCCPSHHKLLQLLQREEDESQAKYEQCGFDQARLSTEIAGHLGLDTADRSASAPSCDDWMIRYTRRHYCQCSGCIYFFNKKDLELFGRFWIRSKDSSSSRSRSSSINISCNSDVGDKNLSVGSFYCLECYERILDQQDEEETAATVRIGTTINPSDSSPDSGDCSPEQQKPLMCNSSTSNAATSKETKTNTGRKRRKKRRTGRKKKKVPQEPSLLLSSSPPETKRKEINSCFSLTPGVSFSECSTVLIESEKRDELTSTSANAPNREGSNVSIRESCPNTTTTITTTTNSTAATTNKFLDGIHNPAKNGKPANANSVNDDPNELWLEYLWKTGSMIALDRYMDDMEDTLGEEDII